MWVLIVFSAAPVAAAQAAVPSGEFKVTTSDPEFIPLSEEKAIKKGLPWWVYVIGVAAIAGAAAAAGGGGGGGGDTAPTTGTVTGGW